MSENATAFCQPRTKKRGAGLALPWARKNKKAAPHHPTLQSLFSRSGACNFRPSCHLLQWSLTLAASPAREACHYIPTRDELSEFVSKTISHNWDQKYTLSMLFQHLFTMMFRKLQQIFKNKTEAQKPGCWHVCWRRKAILIIAFSTGHSCGTPWHDTLIWQWGRTPLLDTIAQNSCETHLPDRLIWHSDLTILLDTLIWHSCGALLLDTFVGHSYLRRFLDTLTRHSCKTLWPDTLLGHSCGDTLPWHCSGTLLLDTPLELTRHSCGTLWP